MNNKFKTHIPLILKIFFRLNEYMGLCFEGTGANFRIITFDITINTPAHIGENIKYLPKASIAKNIHTEAVMQALCVEKCMPPTFDRSKTTLTSRTKNTRTSLNSKKIKKSNNIFATS